MRHPIFITAAVTSGFALAAWGTLLWQLSPADRRRTSIMLLLAAGFFMSPLAFFGVRRPLLVDRLEPILSQPQWDAPGRSIARDVVRLSFAPLTEEPAKLFPWLLLLAVGQPLWPTRRMIAPLALAIGLGFAVGEIWLVASFVAQANNPQLAGIPWYAFGGFISERLMTCVTHALFALPTVWLARRGWKWALAGLAGGMLLHGLSNAPIVLIHRGALGLKPEAWQALLQIWLILLTVYGLAALLVAFAGRKLLSKMWSRRMVCPGCGCVYRQPLLYAFNFGLTRYERCAVCRKWHWVSLKDLAPADGKTQ